MNETDFKAFQELENKANVVDKDRVRYERFNDMGDVLSPSNARRVDAATQMVSLALRLLYHELSQIQCEIKDADTLLCAYGPNPRVEPDMPWCDACQSYHVTPRNDEHRKQLQCQEIPY